MVVRSLAASNLNLLPSFPMHTPSVLPLPLSEVRADDTPAVDAVLSADTTRLSLLEEEKKLVAESEAGNDSNSDRLKQVHLR